MSARQQKGVAEQIVELERRLLALETSPQTQYASVRDGAVVALDGSGLVMARLGKLADGASADGGFGVAVYDVNGYTVFLADGTGLRVPTQVVTFVPRGDRPLAGAAGESRAGAVRVPSGGGWSPVHLANAWLAGGQLIGSFVVDVAGGASVDFRLRFADHDVIDVGSDLVVNEVDGIAATQGVIVNVEVTDSAVFNRLNDIYVEARLNGGGSAAVTPDAPFICRPPT